MTRTLEDRRTTFIVVSTLEEAPVREAEFFIRALDERDGRTTMTTLVEHTKKEHRDGHIESGMEGGMQESLDALEQVARSLADEG